MLARLGYEVEFARNGEEAIEMYERASYDAVILDLTVPGGLGGRRCLQQLLVIDPGVRAIVSSGYSNDPVLANYAEYGFKGALPKPMQLQQVGAVLHQVLTANLR